MSDNLWAVVAAANLCTLATVKRDGRPQLSDVNYTADDKTRVLRASTRSSLAKVHNLRRDPRASLRVAGPGGAGYVVAEVHATFSPPSADEHDATVEELIEVYRLISGKEHPDWDDYRRAMVADGRLVLSLHVERLYGWVM
ncbi:PPOX class F420-dependent oxidoreductase [Amorphoplanes digitatis]|uniref:PPOX class probable F420-dependent enzyme n=1 Tax=Actinoplanes digitatis TaxID=1868 RepID=A0A7W7HTY4_9ACTN|nr:PPOX class F420-dependent oxidoreductase [Actinoplanes digitatis]MBB4760764.1 PPOX class probable F420-dependent enzyme [Actinoplanes digitatis]BFE68990.1 PPOX class F420-dependent oxidoreductase [Actinoplanes digitatis]GID94214.1 PPOX class F420-dependent enzyme [Actinoplanes digitatis]